LFTAAAAVFLNIPSWLILSAQACVFHDPNFRLSRIDFDSLTAENLAARSLSHQQQQQQGPPPPMVIRNVRVFDGSKLLPLGTVVIDNGLIAQVCSAGAACADSQAQSYDAGGMTMLPGLMDSHAHASSCADLGNLTQYGVTTTVTAFCPNSMFCKSLSNYTGLASSISASFLATVSGSQHAQIIGSQYADMLIANTSVAPSWVAGQIKGGADFIKLIGSAPLRGSPPAAGLSQAEQIALVAASHQEGKQVVLHTASYQAYEEGLVAGVDQIHHSTLDVPIDGRLLAMFKARNATKVVCPTLTMMRSITQQDPSMNGSFQPASETVSRLYKAGIPLMAGTDSNYVKGFPAHVQFGTSLHDELENLVAAGLSPVEALNAATVAPATYFGLADRGSIRQGMRADLVLVDGDPTANISDSRNIVKVWVGGLEFNETRTDAMCAEAAAKQMAATATTSMGTTATTGVMATSSTAGAARNAAATLLLPVGCLLAYMAL
jgi:imidazolonepropionase-like amidohydrolase